jgi:integrase
MGNVQTLLNVAKGDGLISSNPLDALSLQLKDDSTRRNNFAPSELKRLIALLDGDELWIRSIGLYSGARLAEICQLQRKDVREIEGVMHFDIHADPVEGRRVKNKNSDRLVPVHKQLIADGLMEWLAPKTGRLFSLTSRQPLSNGAIDDAKGAWMKILNDATETEREAIHGNCRTLYEEADTYCAKSRCVEFP